MPEILHWRTATDPLDLVMRAVRALREGRIVAFPTETVYGIAASLSFPSAIERLQCCKNRPSDKPLAVAVWGLPEAREWAPNMSPLAERLARRCWPGPVTLVVPVDTTFGPVGRLPEPLRRRLCPEGWLGLRAPAHEAISLVLEQLPEQLVLTSANRSGEPAALTAEQVVAALGDDVDMIINDGQCHFSQASTVVRVEGNSFQVLREGVVSRQELERQSARLIVFVCTGNTCRSPLAEALCKKQLADRLQCSVAELPARGFVVLSAGVSAMMGGDAAHETREMARLYGADLSGHRSQQLTPELVSQADELIVMTQSHRLAVQGLFRGLGPEPRLLCPAGQDIDDPIGGDMEVYRECAAEIWQRLEKLVAELDPKV
jgi:protein-tyrosine phosphatase